MNTNKIQNRRIVEHRWHGMRPVYELQVWSNIANKWFVACSGTLNEVDTFIGNQHWAVPETIVEQHNGV